MLARRILSNPLCDLAGDCGIPSVGWQIDTFGNSRENAAVFAAMGFDAVFLCKSGSDHLQRYRQRTAEVSHYVVPNFIILHKEQDLDYALPSKLIKTLVLSLSGTGVTGWPSLAA